MDIAVLLRRGPFNIRNADPFILVMPSNHKGHTISRFHTIHITWQRHGLTGHFPSAKATVRLNLGRTYAAREQHAQAFEHYEAALGLDPANADALLGTGFALLGMGRLDEGVPRLEAAVKRHRAYARRLPPVIDALQSVGREDLAGRLRAALNRAGER